MLGRAALALVFTVASGLKRQADFQEPQMAYAPQAYAPQAAYAPQPPQVAYPQPPQAASAQQTATTACQGGMVAFMRISHLDSNRCFTTCAPMGGCASQILSGNYLVRGSCQQQGYAFKGVNHYKDIEAQGVIQHPECQGMVSDLFSRAPPPTKSGR
mmetsp:Transcript_100229/g.283820  ORF Transcript_100229/g.283820 Transcript_100229/m.283820 type:complete len:157 (+) Transcript_100229:3-473(+)